MIPDIIERNLLLFLAPFEEASESLWRFVPWNTRKRVSVSLASGQELPASTIYCFERSEIMGYLYFSWCLKKQVFPRMAQKVLYLNDGLLSSIFIADKTDGYRAFAANHLPPSTRMRQKLVSLLPLAFRAEKRYVVVGQCSIAGVACADRSDVVPVALDFMFFSNASGKLLLTSAETLCSGKGTVIKTTSSREYEEVMEKEFLTMLSISEMQGEPVSLPRVGQHFQVGMRTFFTEAYVKGKSLREVLHNLSRRNDVAGVCAFLTHLDAWFEKYQATFRANPRSLLSCYQHLFASFSELYEEHYPAGVIQKRAGAILAKVSSKQDVIASITAHNDLWPGNFVVGVDGLVAIDWERAMENRAPFFDYFWMIISAALEHYACNIRAVDYSRAFRLFLAGKDDVSQHAILMLKAFLESHGFDTELLQGFLLLFLMEWSIQGYLALGKQTAMDRLAFGELVFFFEAMIKVNRRSDEF